jgi:hypothetical protein
MRRAAFAESCTAAAGFENVAAWFAARCNSVPVGERASEWAMMNPMAEADVTPRAAPVASAFRWAPVGDHSVSAVSSSVAIYRLAAAGQP